MVLVNQIVDTKIINYIIVIIKHPPLCHISWVFLIKRKLNWFVGSFIVLLIFLSISCLIGSIVYDRIYTHHWYLYGREPKYYKDNRPLYYFIMFMYFVNLNYVIPLSLYVTLGNWVFIR